MVDKREIRKDRYLQLMTKTGIPLAIISVLSLWAGRYFGSPGLGMLFFVTCPLAMAIGLAYNIRYVMLAVRKQREEKEKEEQG